MAGRLAGTVVLITGGGCAARQTAMKAKPLFSVAAIFNVLVSLGILLGYDLVGPWLGFPPQPVVWIHIIALVVLVFGYAYWRVATVTSCGSPDGTYRGMGTLLDADAMRDWMSAMHPLEQGGHTHGAPMMGGNTVPTGQRNLFMLSIVNDRNAIMDALAR